eukprot:4705297-Pyramimonas_sp.AAC.1
MYHTGPKTKDPQDIFGFFPLDMSLCWLWRAIFIIPPKTPNFTIPGGLFSWVQGCDDDDADADGDDDDDGGADDDGVHDSDDAAD